MTNEQSIAALLGLIRDRHSFVVTSHARPDGDAIGSSLGMMHLLEAMGKEVVVAFADPIPEPFECLEGVHRIVHTLPETVPDAVIILECDSIGRTGFAAIPAHFSINIDHHLSGRNYADFNWIDASACAVGALVYNVALAAGVPITTPMADCLYTAVLTDTGSFNYPATNAATFALAEHLLQCGTNANRIAQAMYFSNSVSKVRLLGLALSNMVIEGEVCWSVISQEDMAHTGASVEDCEGVVNHLIGIAGIEAAILLRQQPDLNEYRLSLRSKGVGRVDVSVVAEHFGGGGHRNASGCTQHGTAAAITERLVREVNRQLHPEGGAAIPPPVASHEASPSLLA